MIHYINGISLNFNVHLKVICMLNHELLIDSVKVLSTDISSYQLKE